MEASSSHSAEEEPISIESLIITAESARKWSQLQTMFHVPPWVYQANPDAYTPLLVSIGPFHHIGPNSSSHEEDHKNKNINFQAMEAQKQVFMLRLLDKKAGSRREMLERCWQFMTDNFNQIRGYYGQEINISSDDAFKKLMLVDACFILQLLLEGPQRGFDHNQDNDRVNYASLMLAVRRDLVLLENQLPYFVLQGLYNIIFNRDTTASSYGETSDDSGLNGRVLEFFPLRMQDFFRGPLQVQVGRFSHLLDVIHKFNFMISDQMLLRSRRTTPPSPGIIQQGDHHHRQTTVIIRPPRNLRDTNTLPNATKLQAAGVQLMRSEEVGSLLDIQFSHGCLTIPSLVLNDYTESLLRNLLAYEQVCRTNNTGKYVVASYIIFMNRLIASKEDLELLECERIVVNELGGGGEAASKIFHNISQNCVLAVKDFFLRSLCDEVEDYCDSRWHKYKQDLKQRHFKTPWLTISLCAATFLLLLTLLQTIYTILSFYQGGALGRS